MKNFLQINEDTYVREDAIDSCSLIQETTGEKHTIRNKYYIKVTYGPLGNHWATTPSFDTKDATWAYLHKVMNWE